MQPDDPIALAVRAKAGDRAAMNELVRINLGFVYQRARAWAKRCPRLEVEELVSEGVMGIMRAVQTFDASAGNKFLTYAGPWIEHRMGEASANVRSDLSGFGRTCDVVLGKRFRADEDALREQGLDREAVVEALAVKHNIVADRLRDMLRQRENMTAASLDAPIGDDDTSSRYDLHGSFTDTAETIARLSLDASVRRRIDALRPELTERECAVLDDRLLADEPQTLLEIGDRFGVSRERIRQIEAKLTEILADHLRAERAEAFGHDIVPGKRKPTPSTSRPARSIAAPPSSLSPPASQRAWPGDLRAEPHIATVEARPVPPRDRAACPCITCARTPCPDCRVPTRGVCPDCLRVDDPTVAVSIAGRPRLGRPFVRDVHDLFAEAQRLGAAKRPRYIRTDRDTLRQWRRNAGLCTKCGERARDGRALCGWCGWVPMQRRQEKTREAA